MSIAFGILRSKRPPFNHRAKRPRSLRQRTSADYPELPACLAILIRLQPQARLQARDRQGDIEIGHVRNCHAWPSRGSLLGAWIGEPPVGWALERSAPDAAFGVSRLSLGIAIGIARCAAEIDGIAVAHHRLAEIGHAFGAANRDDRGRSGRWRATSQFTLPPLMRVVSFALAARPHSQVLPFASLQV